MSITRDHNDIVVECDGPGCRAFLETETSNFDAALNIMRRSGWKIARKADDWVHLCRDCRPDAKRPAGLPLAHGKTRREHAGTSE